MDFVGLVLGPVLEAFGEPVSYTAPGRGASLDIPKAVFREAYQFVEVGDVPMAATAPAVLAPLAPFGENHPLEQGGIFIIRGARYRVREPHPDDRGGVLVRLHRVKE